ncbi:MAG TPA: hypothetical protein VGN20_17955 [Mucilaginibacter sp.]|jgi:hypothetical protein
MKKVYYLLAFIAVGFTACQKQPIVGLGGSGSNEVKTLNLTLASADYSSLGSSVYASKTKNFNSDADAKTYIPAILNKEYPQLSNGSVANIVFSEQPVLADSVYKDQQYTLVTTPVNDYKLLPGNNFSDFSIAQTIAWLPYKFPTPTDPQQEILTFIWYNGQTTVPGSVFAFLYFNGAWKQAYLLTPAQYVAVGHPAYNQFTAADDANIPSYLNATLKADPAVMATAKAGISVQYVSFNYYLSSTKVTSQRVFTMAYNGTDWIKTATNTLAFIKSGNAWIPDPTVYYTLNTADTKLIAASTFGTAAQRTNLGSYGDFSGWAKGDVQNGIILVLTADFPSPKVNVNYKVTYLNYTGGADVPTVLVFQYDGTKWVAM